MTGQSTLPLVSVIIPALNAARRIQPCLQAALNQSYPSDRYEIIVIDNGSTDDTPRLIQEYPVIFLVENQIQSPYAARNKGIQQATGEIIALLDTNCQANPDWLKNGVQTLQEQQAHLAGGKVTFTFAPPKTIAKMYDSLTHARMQSSIKERGACPTLNLFIRKEVFAAIGLFPAHQRSGADLLWTGRATRAGFKLVYAPTAEVNNPARGFWPLLKKSLRVGRGHPEIWLDQGWRLDKVILWSLLEFRPPSPAKVRAAIHQRGTPDMEQKFVALWLMAWLCNAAQAVGRLIYLAEYLAGFQKPQKVSISAKPSA